LRRGDCRANFFGSTGRSSATGPNSIAADLQALTGRPRGFAQDQGILNAPLQLQRVYTGSKQSCEPRADNERVDQREVTMELIAIGLGWMLVIWIAVIWGSSVFNKNIE
jgi:hypothetical protein